MQRYFDVVQSRTGDAIVGGLVSVFISGTTTLATLYADNGVTLQANPVTTNSDGEYAFYAANGTYTLQITATNYVTETKPGVVLFDPSDSGASNNVSFTPVGNISATNVQAAIAELDSQTYVSLNATGNGSQTIFPVSSVPKAIYINGVYQNQNTYTVAGGSVTFTQAPPVTSVIEFLF